METNYQPETTEHIYLAKEVLHGTVEAEMHSLIILTWVSWIDLKDVHLHITIYPSHCKFLWFILQTLHIQFHL